MSVAVTALKVIAAHTVLGLHVADDRLDRGTTFHLATDRSGDAAYLAADPDAERLFVIMAAIALVDMDAARADPGLPLQFDNHRAEGVAVKRPPKTPDRAYPLVRNQEYAYAYDWEYRPG